LSHTKIKLDFLEQLVRIHQFDIKLIFKDDFLFYFK